MVTRTHKPWSHESGWLTLASRQPTPAHPRPAPSGAAGPKRLPILFSIRPTAGPRRRRSERSARRDAHRRPSSAVGVSTRRRCSGEARRSTDAVFAAPREQNDRSTTAATTVTCSSLRCVENTTTRQTNAIVSLKHRQWPHRARRWPKNDEQWSGGPGVACSLC